MVMEFNQRQNGASAKAYYQRDEPCLAREFGGKGLEYLGVEADQLGVKEFNRLVDNRHPLTNTKLTPIDAANRICCWDITINVPKSVTLLRHFGQNPEQVEQAVLDANAFIMGEIEKIAATRQRAGGVYGDQQTGNLVWRSDYHMLSRPVNGRVMPHDHIHNVVMNSTWDGERFKAAKVHSIVKHMPDFQEAFHKRLRRNLEDIGYRTKGKGLAWQVEGISKATVRKFSERRGLIEEYMVGKSKAAGKKAGMATREDKPVKVDIAALKAEWTGMLTRKEKNVMKWLQARPKVGRPKLRHKRVAYLRTLAHNLLDSPGRYLNGPRLDR